MKELLFKWILVIAVIIYALDIPTAIYAASEINNSDINKVQIHYYIRGHGSTQIAFLVINQQPVLSLCSKYGGVSAGQRIQTIVTKINGMIVKGVSFKSTDFKITEGHFETVLKYREETLVIADPITAVRHRMTCYKLAKLWQRNLQNVFAADGGYFITKETFQGTASWYGKEFYGRRTANGEQFDEMCFTAAHRSLPFGTKLRVTNLENNDKVIVTVNDRGPWIRGRLIDLSWAAARAIGISGIAMVRVEVLGN